MIFFEYVGSRACLSAENEWIIEIKCKNLVPIFCLYKRNPLKAHGFHGQNVSPENHQRTMVRYVDAVS